MALPSSAQDLGADGWRKPKARHVRARGLASARLRQAALVELVLVLFGQRSWSCRCCDQSGSAAPSNGMNRIFRATPSFQCTRQRASPVGVVLRDAAALW